MVGSSLRPGGYYATRGPLNHRSSPDRLGHMDALVSAQALALFSQSLSGGTGNSVPPAVARMQRLLLAQVGTLGGRLSQRKRVCFD